MYWVVSRWTFAAALFIFAEVGPPSWVDNPWIQLGAVGAMAVCLVMSLLDNAKARKDWLKQLSEQNQMRRDDAIGIQQVLNRVIEHCGKKSNSQGQVEHPREHVADLAREQDERR